MSAAHCQLQKQQYRIFIEDFSCKVTTATAVGIFGLVGFRLVFSGSGVGNSEIRPLIQVNFGDDIGLTGL